MPSGFQTFNEAGNLQVDSSTYSYYFVGKGTINAQMDSDPAEQGNTYPMAYAQGPVVAPYDLVAFSCTQAGVVPHNTMIINGPTGVDTKNNPSIFVFTSPTTQFGPIAVNYWLFRSVKDVPVAANGLGLEAYNTDGTICYSSKLKPLRVIQDIPITSSTPMNSNVSLPGGFTYAFISYGRSNLPRTPNGYREVGVQTITNGCTLGIVNSPGASDVGFTGGFLCVDVTGY
jgi:hypothetical protein